MIIIAFFAGILLTLYAEHVLSKDALAAANKEIARLDAVVARLRNEG